jgi:outer membrane receptor protein involved in Fe transport
VNRRLVARRGDRHGAINGRAWRRPGGNGAAIDVSAIPIAAIEPVEVLKDGASGVCGSDAIGVINFILIKDFQGIELGATLGADAQRRRRRRRATLWAGDRRNDNVTVARRSRGKEALFGRERDSRRLASAVLHRRRHRAAASRSGTASNGSTPYDPAAETRRQHAPEAGASATRRARATAIRLTTTAPRSRCTDRLTAEVRRIAPMTAPDANLKRELTS